MKKIILLAMILGINVMALDIHERSVSYIGNIVIDIDLNLTKGREKFYIEKACASYFKDKQSKIYCKKIVSLDIDLNSGFSERYFSRNKNIYYKVSKIENYYKVQN